MTKADENNLFWIAVILVGGLVLIAVSVAAGSESSFPTDNDSSAIIAVETSTKGELQATPIPAPEVDATAPCLVATSGAGSGPGIGLAFGKTSEDEGCTMREDIRTLISVGMIDEARRLACFLPSLERVALRVECLKKFSP